MRMTQSSLSDSRSSVTSLFCSTLHEDASATLQLSLHHIYAILLFATILTRPTRTAYTDYDWDPILWANQFIFLLPYH